MFSLTVGIRNLSLFILYLFASSQTSAEELGGQQTFIANCAPCHSLTEGDHQFGPSLFGVYGRLVGQATGFSYSQSYLDAAERGLVWDDPHLDRFLADPTGFLSSELGTEAQNIMPTRYPDSAVRAAIIQYLSTLSQ
ncbi:c-type cytochrome [Phyllobacterium sp. P5_D12]